jgi:hypothetical protein
MRKAIRVLLVAPEMGLNTVEEIRLLTEMHSVHVLSGHLTWADFLDACRRGRSDIIHFAVHSDSQRLRLNGDLLTPLQVAQAARLAGAKVLFFNSCESARHAAFAVRNGVDYAIHTTEKVMDAQAWQTPLAFYEYLRVEDEEGEVDYPGAFVAADSGDGLYGLYSSIRVDGGLATLATDMKRVVAQLHSIEVKVKLAYLLLFSGMLLSLWR